MVTKAYLNPDKDLNNRYKKTILFIESLHLNYNNNILDLG